LDSLTTGQAKPKYV